jgi:ATP-dependent helicase YprA (DUF1998 family)
MVECGNDILSYLVILILLCCRKTLAAFKEGKIDVLIGTDIMARGIHIDGLKYVINYDMPPYVKTYIHRGGRTARAGESGSCFTFLRKHEVMHCLTVTLFGICYYACNWLIGSHTMIMYIA